MSDLPNADLQTGQAGQPVSPSVAQPAAQPAPVNPKAPGEAEQQYVTKTEAEQLARNAASEALRQAQSLNDKTRNKILNEVAKLQKAGITATPEQVAQMISVEEANAPLNSPVEAQPAAQQPASTVSDPVTRKSISIIQEIAGEGFDPDQPEFKLIKQTEDPEEFLTSVREAASAYAKRVGNLSNPARIPSIAGGAPANVPVHAGMNSTDTIGLAIKEQFQNK